MGARSRPRQAAALALFATTLLPALVLVDGIPTLASPLYWVAAAGTVAAQRIGGYTN
jgi:hypothetical protein